MYSSVAMLTLIESIIGHMSVMSSSLISSIPDGYLSNYFTYHFVLDSYIGGHSVVPENSTVPVILSKS